MRPEWDPYFLAIAEAVAARAECTRRKVGAVITVEHRIAVCGYNGTPPKVASCLYGGCPRGRHYKAYAAHEDGEGIVDFCACHLRHPCPDFAEPGSSYDNPGAGFCSALHAEQNALLDAAKRGVAVKHGTIYVTSEPCIGCYKMLAGAELTRLAWTNARGEIRSADYPFLSCY